MASTPDPALATLLLQSSTDGILAFDLECRYTLWNSSMERMTGIPATEAVGRVAFEVFPFIREIGEDRNFMQALAGEATISLARPFSVPSTGKSGYFEGYYSPVRDPEGNVVGGMAVIHDVTERTEKAVEARFRALVEQAPFSIQIYSLDGLCIYANPAWERFWASDRAGLADYNILKDPHIVEHGVKHLVERAFAGEIVTLPDNHYDPARIGKVGRTRWIRASFFPVRDSTGRLVEIAEVLEDVSDAKALEKKSADLASAVQSRDTFLSIASHELRTPVTLMKMQIERSRRNLARDEGDTPSARRMSDTLDRVETSFERLAKLIERMFDVSHIGTGRLGLELERVELAPLVAEVADRFREELESAGIELTLDLAENPVGFWDRHRVDQVLTNLITNAIRYAPRAPLSIRTGRSATTASVVVSDRGPGIAREHHSRIFERFARLVTPRVGGLGLGLHISQEIAAAHGGRIRLESEPGRGSTFVLELPLRNSS
jgi:PAS domain S-box-containing protein